MAHCSRLSLIVVINFVDLLCLMFVPVCGAPLRDFIDSSVKWLFLGSCETGRKHGLNPQRGWRRNGSGEYTRRRGQRTGISVPALHVSTARFEWG